MNQAQKVTVAKKGNFYAVYVNGKEVRCAGSLKYAKEMAKQLQEVAA